MASSPSRPIASPGSATDLPSAEYALGAARHHFGGWPLVPSRELRRIRHVLLHASSSGGPQPELSQSARELLDLVTSELQRREQIDSPSDPAKSQAEQPLTPESPEKKGRWAHDRSL